MDQLVQILAFGLTKKATGFWHFPDLGVSLKGIILLIYFASFQVYQSLITQLGSIIFSSIVSAPDTSPSQ